MDKSIFGFLLSLCAIASAVQAEDWLAWPRFRGPGGSGVAERATPPIELGAEKNLLWRVELPPGVSSPVVAGERVFLTGFEDGHLLTFCVDRQNGKMLWKRQAPAESLEKYHRFSSPAAATPVTDGNRVYVYFGSCGLLAYGVDGSEAWRLPLPRPNMDWGTASSPVLVDGRVVQVCDSMGTGSYIVAVDAQSGAIVWKKPRVLFQAGWSTPTVWKHDGKTELIVAGSGRLVSYEPADGTERWSVRGFPQQPIMSPVLGDGMLFCGIASAGDASDHLGEIPDFATMLKLYDKNHDGKISPDEIPEDAGIYLRKEVPKYAPGNFLSLRWLVIAAARGKPGISAFDWTLFQAAFKASGPTMMAVRPTGEGDITESAVAWKTSKNVPEIPTPLYLDGRLYLVRDGGRISCLDAKTGEVIYHGRIDAPGQHVASPVEANGNIYVASEPGTITILKAGGDRLNVVATNAINERIMATPAIVGNMLLVRTEKHLFAWAAAKNQK